jgi:hypothetical protein
LFKSKAAPQEVYTYEVFPVNYATLPPKKQEEVLGKFQAFINSLGCEARIWIVKTEQKVPVGNEEYQTVFYRFYVESLGEPVDWLLEQCGFKCQPVTELPKVEPVKVFPKLLVLPGGKLMKTFTIYSLPGILWPGFLYSVFGVCDRIIMQIRPPANR